MKLLVCIVALAALSACGMLAVKEQQAKIDAVCRIGGSVEAERKDAVPIIVVLARQVGADPEKRESWQLADHFVLEGPGLWQFSASAGTYGVVAFQDLNRDLKHQPDEPYLRLEREGLFTCKAGRAAHRSRAAHPRRRALAFRRDPRHHRAAGALVQRADRALAQPGDRGGRGRQPHRCALRPGDRRRRAVAAVRFPVQGRSGRLFPRSPTTARRSRCSSCTASTARRRISAR